MIVTWERLDACETPDAVAALLRQYGIRGVPRSTENCPLARATGWLIIGRQALSKDKREQRRLTEAQTRFVWQFDDDEEDYYDLIDDTEEVRQLTPEEQ